jgi:hypothetical protein
MVYPLILSRVPTFACADSAHELETSTMFSTAMDAAKEMWQELREQGFPEIGEGSPKQGAEGREREGSKPDMWITLSFLLFAAESADADMAKGYCCKSKNGGPAAQHWHPWAQQSQQL